MLIIRSLHLINLHFWTYLLFLWGWVLNSTFTTFTILKKLKCSHQLNKSFFLTALLTITHVTYNKINNQEEMKYICKVI